MENNYVFTADLVAFVEQQDLPPFLYPFIRPSNRKEMATIVGTDYNLSLLVIFKIRETIDSYHTIVVNENMNIKQVEDKIQKDLGAVKLPDETRNKLKELLEKLHKGEFSYFLNHKVLLFR